MLYQLTMSTVDFRPKHFSSQLWLETRIGDLSPTGHITRTLVVDKPVYGHVIFVDL
jgi:hypothetical protein